MRHTRHGYWLEEAGGGRANPQLEGEVNADFLVLGAGFTGLWTAWHLLDATPEARVVILDAERAGHGPSGRNGGFVESLAPSWGLLEQALGKERAGTVLSLSRDSVQQIESFCEREGVEAGFRHGGMIRVATAPAQEAQIERQLRAAAEIDDPSLAPRPLTVEEVRARCDSPLFRAGLLHPEVASVQPARLALGLIEALKQRGARIHDFSPALSIGREVGGFAVRTGSGSVRAPAAVLAIGGAFAGRRSPLRNALTVASSQIAITEPVPDMLERIGWTGGECITDGRALLHYFRTTPDGRIAFGWGGGVIAYGGRTHGRVERDRRVIETVIAALRAHFPGLAGRRVEHAWGGPIDASPRHLPLITELPGGAFAAFGYTGNGVGPSQMIGRALASLALGRHDEYSTLPLVEPASSLRQLPPEPLRWLGATAIRAAIAHNESIEMSGRDPSSLTRAIARIPAQIGFHIGR